MDMKGKGQAAGARDGIFKRGGAWWARFTCGRGCRHKERIGPIKSDAAKVRDQRRTRAHTEPTWCPKIERADARAQARTEREQERRRVTFREYAERDFTPWAKLHHRSWRKDDSRLSRVLPVFGDRKLDEITTADIERFLGTLQDGERAVRPATVNRYRDLLSGMLKRAKRLGLIPSNPVTGIPKHKEPGGRIVYLPPASPGRPAYEEDALRDALPVDIRPAFVVSVNTGLRWSEQAGLQWRDVDMLSRTIGVGRSKNGYSRCVPMNSAVRAVLVDLATQRANPDEPGEPVFRLAYRTTARAFERAVARARESLRDAGKDATHLDGYTWHGNRHTFASRLVMAGVDLLSVQKLGGWRTLSMVQRYAHLAPGHLAAAVERLAMDWSPDGPSSGAAEVAGMASDAQACESKATEG
jgi:integrase